MKNTLQTIVASIVEKSDAVTIVEEEREGVTTFVISVDPSDMGKVIGKEGKIIRAIRNVMKIPAIKQGKRINVTLADQSPRN